MGRSRELNDASADQARALLARACGSSRWVDRMMARRPFASDARLLFAARNEWFGLMEWDWLEAFSHHPRIGDRAALESRFPATHDLSSKEQSGIGIAGADVLQALAQANNDYFDRFGFIFIVCATGKSAPEMLALLLSRLQNDRATELRIAAEEQCKITALRLS
ncbi:MAG: 2-oxo-4-hydroxy-4-carboxy-5-ureidoimidazoline decarboxylase [Cyanobacteria bacterium]|nr:2-oxo-4-hydroxy-4-carboxy-5-ureidoimidazoline decarboxylase [Cyanobacteriota bacterium]